LRLLTWSFFAHIASERAGEMLLEGPACMDRSQMKAWKARLSVPIQLADPVPFVKILDRIDIRD